MSTRKADIVYITQTTLVIINDVLLITIGGLYSLSCIIYAAIFFVYFFYVNILEFYSEYLISIFIIHCTYLSAYKILLFTSKMAVDGGNAVVF